MDPIAIFKQQQAANKARLGQAVEVEESGSKVGSRRPSKLANLMDESPPMSPATIKRRSKQVEEANRDESDVLATLGIQKTADMLAQEEKKRASIEWAVNKLASILRPPEAPAQFSKTKWSVAYKFYKAGKLKLDFIDFVEANPGADYAQYESSKNIGAWDNFAMDCKGTVQLRMQFTPQYSENSVVGSLPGAKSCVATRWNGYDSWIACAYFDGCVTVFDVEENCAFNTQDVGCLKQMPGGEWRMTSQDDDTIAVTNARWCPPPNNSFLACTATGGLLVLWQVSQKVQGLVACTRDPTDEFYGLDWTSDARFLVVGGRDRVVKAFDAHNDLQLACGEWKFDYSDNAAAGHSNRILSVKSHPRDPMVVFSAGIDQSVHVWDLRDSKHAGAFAGAVVESDSLDVDQQGRYILTAGQSNAGAHLDVWDLRTMTPVYKTGSESIPNMRPTCAGFSKDSTNKFLHVGGEYDSTAHAFRSPTAGTAGNAAGSQLDPGSLDILATLTGAPGAFRCLESANKMSSVAYGTMDGTVSIVDYNFA